MEAPERTDRKGNFRPSSRSGRVLTTESGKRHGRKVEIKKCGIRGDLAMGDGSAPASADNAFAFVESAISGPGSFFGFESGGTHRQEPRSRTASGAIEREWVGRCGQYFQHVRRALAVSVTKRRERRGPREHTTATMAGWRIQGTLNSTTPAAAAAVFSLPSRHASGRPLRMASSR